MQLLPHVLEGSTVLLSPLSDMQLPELTRVALSAPAVWTHIPWRMQDAAGVAQVAALALELQARGDAVTFSTRLRQTGNLIGGTTIRVVDRSVPSVEIGGTWILPEWQRTRVNSETKFLQLTHCFEQLGCQRVELKTDVLNLRSRAAIRRLGATEEGVLRSHMRRADGSLRDSVLFSIIAPDWPALRERLQARLG
jgi:RimJ/RimL family protein N-acetyltransferase